MKVHFYFDSTTNGNLDLNKALPDLTKRFPDSNVSIDTQFIGKRRIVIEKPIKEVKIIKLDKMDCDIDANFTLYLYETIGYAYLDICIDIDSETLKKLVKDNRNLFNNVIGEAKIKHDGKIVDLAPSLILPLFTDKVYGDKIFEDPSSSYHQNLEVDMDQMSTKLSDFKDKFHTTPIVVLFILSFDMSLSPCAYTLIEDFDDKLDIDSRWQNISNNENSLFESNTLYARICKKKDMLKSLDAFNFGYNYNRKLAARFLEWIKAWLIGLGEEVSNIRDNISKDNSNPYYWKQLKKRIEILDLNFLEFNSYVMQKIDFGVVDRVDLHLKESYTQKISDFNNEQRKNIFRYLNEVKTSIANIGTPGHTHDEKILQEETEKVNDRILMLSFIAMSIPTISAILTPGVSNSVKIMIGGGVLLLPVTYLLVRKIVKNTRFSKSMQLESKRIIADYEVKLKEGKQRLEDVHNHKDIPEDFKAQLIKIYSTLVNQLEGRVKSLKEKL